MREMLDAYRRLNNLTFGLAEVIIVGGCGALLAIAFNMGMIALIAEGSGLYALATGAF
jgi:hypothetical protein